LRRTARAQGGGRGDDLLLGTRGPAGAPGVHREDGPAAAPEGVPGTRRAYPPGRAPGGARGCGVPERGHPGARRAVRAVAGGSPYGGPYRGIASYRRRISTVGPSGSASTVRPLLVVVSARSSEL